jgi:hypothetical protein
MQTSILEQALAEVSEQGYADRPAIVLGREGWGQGLVGIVAGRLADTFARPVIVIGNHTSHMDSTALYYALPRRLRSRLYFAAAADRWFLKGRKGIRKQPWWRRWRVLPITGRRPGGCDAEWLIDKGSSIAIFPRARARARGRWAASRPAPPSSRSATASP